MWRNTLSSVLLVAAICCQARAADLYAYCTRIDSGQPFERFERVDDYADIVVKLGKPDGRLISVAQPAICHAGKPKRGSGRWRRSCGGTATARSRGPTE
jgi:hypothetical protein